MVADSQATLSVKPAPKRIGLWSNNFLSNWFFIWVFPIIKRGQLRDIHSMAFKLREQETARVNVDKLDAAWRKELEIHKK
jgi:hypothetical protein